MADCTAHPTPEHMDTHAVFPSRLMTFRNWVDDVAVVMKDLVKGDRSERADRIRTRADALALCITGLRLDVCTCGAPRPASGRLTSAGKPCNARTCPHCARRRAKVEGDWARKAVEEIESDTSHGHRWRHIVLTCVYDPDNPADMTVDALSARERGLARAWGEIWKRGLGGKTKAAWKSVECAGVGNVHLHVLYWGPWVDQDFLAATQHRAWSGGSRLMRRDEVRAGTGDKPVRALVHLGERRRPWVVGRIVRVAGDEITVDIGTKEAPRSVVRPRGELWYPPINYVTEVDGSKAVAEVVKYTLKSPGGKAEAWFSARRRWVINPGLVARWELAIFGKRVSERYGLFRKVERPADEREVTDLERETCVECRAVGEWHTEYFELAHGIRICHDRSMIALQGNQWGKDKGVRAVPRSIQSRCNDGSESKSRTGPPAEEESSEARRRPEERAGYQRRLAV